MKEDTLKQSLILILFCVCGFLLASSIPKLIDSFLIGVVTMTPIFAISILCFLQGFYGLLKIAYKRVMQKVTY